MNIIAEARKKAKEMKFNIVGDEARVLTDETYEFVCLDTVEEMESLDGFESFLYGKNKRTGQITAGYYGGVVSFPESGFEDLNLNTMHEKVVSL